MSSLNDLQPQLLPFNSIYPRSVVILDNATIHHVEPAMSLIEETGALALFLPPYTHPISCQSRNVSQKLSYLRAYDPYIQILNEMEEMILSAFTSVTAEDCYGWMQDCGYM